MENLQLSILISLPLFLILTQVAIMVYLIRIIEKIEKKFDPHEKEVAAEVRSQELLSSASKQANDMMVSAELKSIEFLSQQKVAGQDVIAELKKHIVQMEQSLQGQFDATTKESVDAYSQFIDHVSKTITQYITDADKRLEERGQEMLDKTQKSLETLTASVQELVKKQVEEEMASVKKEIEDYKAKRIRVIDERIIDILEEVLRLTLDKKLSMVDQSDLIYKALEEAKKDNAFRNAKGT